MRYYNVREYVIFCWKMLEKEIKYQCLGNIKAVHSFRTPIVDLDFL